MLIMSETLQVAHYAKFHVDPDVFNENGTFLFRNLTSSHPSAGLPSHLPLSIVEIKQRALRLHELILNDEAEAVRLSRNLSLDTPADPDVVKHIGNLRRAGAGKRIIYRKLDEYINNIEHQRHLSSSSSSSSLHTTPVTMPYASNTPVVSGLTSLASLEHNLPG
jgi:hypothetical protein